MKHLKKLNGAALLFTGLASLMGCSQSNDDQLVDFMRIDNVKLSEDAYDRLLSNDSHFIMSRSYADNYYNIVSPVTSIQSCFNKARLVSEYASYPKDISFRCDYLSKTVVTSKIK